MEKLPYFFIIQTEKQQNARMFYLILLMPVILQIHDRGFVACSAGGFSRKYLKQEQ